MFIDTDLPEEVAGRAVRALLSLSREIKKKRLKERGISRGSQLGIQPGKQSCFMRNWHALFVRIYAKHLQWCLCNMIYTLE